MSENDAKRTSDRWGRSTLGGNVSIATRGASVSLLRTFIDYLLLQSLKSHSEVFRNELHPPVRPTYKREERTTRYPETPFSGV